MREGSPAADRENDRPAPCGDEFSDIGLPSPSTTYDAVPIDPGMRPSRPTSAWIAPLRDTHTDLPKCVLAARVKLWWQLIRSRSSTGAPTHSLNCRMTRSIISSRFSRAKCCAHRSSAMYRVNSGVPSTR